jgi:hypothetical protein
MLVAPGSQGSRKLMSGAHSQWLLTPVNAVREVMLGRPLD